jgi:hypothetical protein
MPAKSLPITNRDRARIIQALHRTPIWSGHRGGRKVAMQRIHDLQGNRVRWTLFIQNRRITGEENTVYDAVLVLNANIMNSFDCARRKAS